MKRKQAAQTARIHSGVRLKLSGTRRFPWGLLLLLQLCVLPSAHGYQIGQTSLEYARTLWRVSDGLPENTVQAIVASSPRQLWMGTTGGLVRFDGAHMQSYGNGNGRQLPVNSIFCLTVARDGALWAGTEGGGLLRIDRDGWRAYSRRDGLENGFVRAVFEDSRGTLWVGTDDGLFQRRGDRFERRNLASVFSSPGSSPFAVHAIMEDRDHTLWVGGSELDSIAPDGRVTSHPLSGTFSGNRVKSILQTSDGTVWVGTVGGIERMIDGRFQMLSGLRATVRYLMQSSDGTLWIATIGSGLWNLRDGVLGRADSPGLLPSDTLLALYEDSTNQIWIGTQAGLVRLSRTPVRIIPLPKTGDPDTETIFGDNDSRIWVAARYLYSIEGSAAYRANLPPIGNASVRNVFRAGDGALWVGTDGSGAFRLRDHDVTHLLAPARLTNNFVRAFLEIRSGDLWIATDEGVTRLQAGGSTEKITESNGLAYFSTRSLLEDRGGNIWIGTDRGISRWTAGHFVQDDVTARLSQEKIWSLLEDRSGALWFGTRDHGLFRLAQGNLVQFTTADGLPANSIYAVLQDPGGTFWITGPDFISSVPERQMDAASPALLNVVIYKMPFAADGAQLYGGRQPAGYAAPDGSVWFPTNRGVAQVRAAVTIPLPQPEVLIDSVQEDGVEISTTGNLKIPAYVHRLSVAFSAASLQPQEGLRFRWKLEGFDKDWNTAGTNRTATYTNLPTGHYRLLVAVSDPARSDVGGHAEIMLFRAPFFYQTWWFSLLGAVALISLGLLLYQMRIRQMAKRFAAVLEERERVAREMHDTVIQGCTGISVLLEALGMDTGILSRARQSELLDCARDQARRTIDEARQAVWNLRRLDQGVDLVEALRGVAAQTMRDGSSSVQVQHNVARLEMAASPANEILMTVREALSNAVRHSGSKIILVDLRNSAEELTLSIRDYGCGMQSGGTCAPEMHYGIVGMRERMHRLGGGLQIDGGEGAGTTVRLQLRWGSVPKTSARVK